MYILKYFLMISCELLLLVLKDLQLDWLLLFQADQGFYNAKVRDMIERNEYRLIVNINDLRAKNEERANKWVQKKIFLK